MAEEVAEVESSQPTKKRKLSKASVVAKQVVSEQSREEVIA